MTHCGKPLAHSSHRHSHVVPLWCDTSKKKVPCTSPCFKTGAREDALCGNGEVLGWTMHVGAEAQLTSPSGACSCTADREERDGLGRSAESVDLGERQSGVDKEVNPCVKIVGVDLGGDCQNLDGFIEMPCICYHTRHQANKQGW